MNVSPENSLDSTRGEAENELPTNTKSFLTNERIKAAIFAFIAVAVLVGNFFLESGQASDVSFDQKNSSKLAVDLLNNEIELRMDRENILPGNAILRFQAAADLVSGDGVDQGVVAKQLLKADYDDQGRLGFDFAGGRMWGDFTVSDLGANVRMGNVVLMPSKGAFDLKFDGSKVELAVYKGDVYVGFLPQTDGEEVQSYFSAYDNAFINSFLVPQGNQIQIPLRKVNEELRPLLPSKLAKELKYSLIPAADKDDKWVKDNLLADQKFIESKKQDYRSEIISKGRNGEAGMMSEFIFWSKENLTFIPEKKETVLSDSLFTNIDQAVFAANEKDNLKMMEYLARFDNEVLQFSTDISESPVYKSRIEDYVQNLQFFGPSDLEYQVLNFLLQKLKVDDYKLMDFYWYNVYLALSQGQGAAEKSLNDYYQKLEMLFDREEPNFVRYLSDRNQLFDNLLLNYPVFYRDGYFQMKNIIEEKLLENYAPGQMRDEVIQSFVARKIDFMKRLKKHFFDGNLQAPEAKKIFKRLITEAKDMLPKDQTSIAVIELFQSELNDVNDFWGYLNSPEYQVNFYGTTHEERYAAYLEERDSIYSFVNVQQDVFGEVVEEEKTIEEVMDEVDAYFAEMEKVANLEIGDFDNAKERYIPIKAVLGGYPFSALFDRDTGSVKEVYVYEEAISDRLIKIDSLYALLQEKYADLAEDIPVSEEEEVTLETTAQRTARLYIAKLISEHGFEVEIDDVIVFDEKKGIYRIEKISLEDYPSLEVTFDLIMSGEVVTHLFMTIGGEPKVIDGEFTLEELAGLVEAEREFQEHGIEYLLEDFGKRQSEEEKEEVPAVSAETKPVKR